MSQQTVATTGRNTVVSVSADASAATWTVIAQAKNITFSGPKSNFEDTTNLSSVGGIQEFVPTTIDPGTATLQVVWNQTDPGQLMVAAQFYAQTLCSYKVQYPPQAGLTTGPVKEFKAYVAENGLPSADISKATEYSVQLRISGAITEIAGS